MNLQVHPSDPSLMLFTRVESFPQDFQEIMQDLSHDQGSGSHSGTSPRDEALKREASDLPDASPTSRPRLHTNQNGGEALLCAPAVSNQTKANEVPTVSCYMAAVLQKKVSKGDSS